MRRQDHDRCLRHLVQLVHENGALPFQVAHHVEVVDDLLADVDGAAVELERSLDGVHRTFDAGAVPTRSREEDRSHAPIVPMPASCTRPLHPARRRRRRVAVCRPAGLGWSLSASDRVARSSCARRALPTFPWWVWRAFMHGEGELESEPTKVAQERTRPGGDAYTHDLAR